MEPTTQADLRLGLVLNGRYRITSQLGEGGMGLVYRGERLELGKPVAIKFLHSPYAHSARFVARFQREARAMSKLSHPYCVSVLDFGVQEAPYIVMDFVTGSTLREVLDEGRLLPRRALHIARQLLAGLAHAHGQGVIHRDIKPGNIMLGEATGLGDHVRIFDFGLAKLHDPELDGEPSMAAIVGTPAYMAPEQARADKVDERADLYAAGVVLFEMLTGKKPFQSGETYEILAMQRDKLPPRLRELSPELSPELEALVAKALEKDPARRFQTAAEFAAAIDLTPEWLGTAPALPVRERGPEEIALAKTQAVSTGDVQISTSASVAGQPAAGGKRGGRGSWFWGLVLVLGAAGFGGWKLHTLSEALPGGSLGSLLAKSAPPAQLDPRAAVHEQAAQNPPPTPPSATATGAGLAAAPSPDPALENPTAAAIGAGAPADSAVTADAGEVPELSEAVLAAADEALNDPEESEVQLPAPAGPDEPRVSSMAQVNTLIRKGQLDAAIRGVQQLRRATPRSAQLPYMLGTLYIDKHWWSDGLAKYREAIKLSASYRKNARIQRDAIRALADDKTYPRARALLVRDIGRSAVSSLRRAAKSDPSRDVRRRAASVLKQVTR